MDIHSIDTGFIVVCFVVVFCMTYTLGFFVAWEACKDQMRKEALKRGFAGYDAKTGGWKWRDGAEK